MIGFRSSRQASAACNGLLAAVLVWLGCPRVWNTWLEQMQGDFTSSSILTFATLDGKATFTRFATIDIGYLCLIGCTNRKRKVKVKILPVLNLAPRHEDV
jgi:hypothetical protein